MLRTTRACQVAAATAAAARASMRTCRPIASELSCLVRWPRLDFDTGRAAMLAALPVAACTVVSYGNTTGNDGPESPLLIISCVKTEALDQRFLLNFRIGASCCSSLSCHANPWPASPVKWSSGAVK